MRGQLFLIFAFLLIAFFSALTFYRFETEALIKRRESLDYHLLSTYFENLKNEEEKIFVYHLNLSLIKNFTLFARKDFWLRDIELRTVFLFIEEPKVIANQQQNLNVTLLNLFGDSITGINITFLNSSKTLNYLADSATYSTSFSFNVSEDSTYNLTLRYYDTKQREYKVEVPLKIGKSKKIGFWVMDLKTEKFSIRKSFLMFS